MANTYYTFSPSFVPGTKVRSDEVNQQYAAIENAFDLMPADNSAIGRGTVTTGIESGSGNAYVVTLTDARTSYQEGDQLVFKATHANTGAATLDLDGIGAVSLVQADGTALDANYIQSGLYYTAVFDLANNRWQVTTSSAAVVSAATDRVNWAQEWATKAEDSLISVAAGGDGVSDYSSLHWAAKSAANAALTAADLVSTNADVVLTNADAASTAADALATAADAVSTAADAAATAADVITTNANAASTAADAISTAADAASTAADAIATAADAVSTAADAAATAADVVTVAGIYDSFDDRYLGVKAVDPTLDNDGNPLLEGALYWNSVSKEMRAYTGTAWIRVSALPAGTPTKGNLVAGNGTDWVAVGVGSDTQILEADSTQTAGIKWAAPAVIAPKRNLIINGGMNIAQRGLTFTSPSSPSYTLDRWRIQHSTTGAVTVTRETEANEEYPFGYYYQVDVTTADASIASTDYMTVSQAVESEYTADLLFGSINNDAKSVTITFMHAHTATGTYCVALNNSANNRSIVAEYTQSVADTWEQSTVTFAGDNAGAWLKYYTSVGIRVIFTLMAGTNYQGAADTWIAAQRFATSNQVNTLSSIANFFRFSNVMMVEGVASVPYIPRLPQEELVLCQRYFEKSYNFDVDPGSVSNRGQCEIYLTGLASAAHNGYGTVVFSANKSGNPTVTHYSPVTGTAGKVYDTTNTADVTAVSLSSGKTGFSWRATMSAASTSCIMKTHWTAESEI